MECVSIFIAFCLLLCRALSAPAVIAAETTSADSLYADISRLQRTVQQLEHQLKELQSVPLEQEKIESPQASLRSSNSALEISGFVAAVYAQEARSGQHAGRVMNQAEVSLAKALGTQTDVALAVSYAGEDISIGSATVSHRWFESGGLLQAWQTTVGQFDVPFGLDCAYYNPLDRRSVSQPEIVSATHESWNDLGLTTTLDFKAGSLDVYAVKGFDSQVWASNDDMPLKVSPDDPRWLTISPVFSLGTRIHLKWHGFECGVSAARGWMNRSDVALSLTGAHARFLWNSGVLKAEVIQLLQAESQQPVTVRGYYVEALKEYGRLFALSRFDYVETQKTPETRSISVGTGVKFTESLETRAEYRMCTDDNHRKAFVQVIAGF